MVPCEPQSHKGFRAYSAKMVWPKLQQSVALEATLSVDSWLILSGVA